ncbi:MAG: hypothetical protein ABI251_12650, partial [Mycobacteriaceae bacterium]
STSTILLMLGINRLAQAAVVLPRAMSANIPFAPEKDGKTLFAGLSSQAQPQAPTRPATRPAVQQSGPVESYSPTQAAPGVDWPAVSRQVSAFVENHRNNRR